MPPVPKEISEPHEAVDSALSNIGTAVTLLHLALEQFGNDHTGLIEEVGHFLGAEIERLRAEAQGHMDKLWVASGGSTVGIARR